MTAKTFTIQGKPSKTYSLGKAFYLYITDGLFWFRLFGGYGLHGKNIEKHPPLFSERYGYRKKLIIGKYFFRFLKPDGQ